MRKFNPPISSYSIEELIFITELNSEDWQKEFVKAARVELTNRGLAHEEIKSRSANIKIEFDKYLEQGRRYRAEVSYTTTDAIWRIIFWHRYLFFEWYLKSQGYHRLARQRIKYILIGFLSYVLFMLWIINHSSNVQAENERKISEGITADSLKQAQVDWTGKYYYSYIQEQNETEWTLELKKINDSKHVGTIEIFNNESYSKHDIEAICSESSVQVFPTKTGVIASQKIISEFDLLFELRVDSKDTLTWWETIKPKDEGFKNGIINFKKL